MIIQAIIDSLGIEPKDAECAWEVRYFAFVVQFAQWFWTGFARQRQYELCHSRTELSS
jgi:hypothetical protein